MGGGRHFVNRLQDVLSTPVTTDVDEDRDGGVGGSLHLKKCVGRSKSIEEEGKLY